MCIRDSVSIHQKAGLSVDKILHECVYAKTLDNITAVMIAFENYERCCTTEISSMEPKEADHYRALLEKKSLEPVDEAFIESDVEPSNLPNVDA